MDTHFDAEIAPVDVIPEEKVAGIRRLAAYFEQFHEVILRSRRM